MVDGNDSTEGDQPLRRVHAALVATLRDFDEACTRLGVEYWIDSGTLLGAVRTGGMIPWDDDIDVCMTRDHLARFLAGVGPHGLGPRYTILTPDEDPSIAVAAKVHVNGTRLRSSFADRHGLSQTTHAGLYLDIVLADPLAPSARQRRVDRSIAWLVGTHGWSTAMARSSKLPLRRRLRWRLASWAPRWLVSLLDGRLTARIRSYDGSLIGVGPAGRFNGFAYPRRVIYPLGRIAFEALQVPCPADTDAYLTGMYGPDYLTPPPAHARVTHTDHVAFDTDEPR